jgi:hypothetical protein
MRRHTALLLTVLPLVAVQAATVEDELRSAQQLAWQKRFAEAEALYRRIVARNPRSRAAALGLGQVLLWEQRYRDAAALYRTLLHDLPNDIDARKGLATAEYWSGDYRAAQRDFNAVVAARPQDSEAREALAGIAATMLLVIASENELVTDDQPLRRATIGLSATLFTDPLTRWTAAAGTHAMSADGGFGSATAPFASIAIHTAVPGPHLRVSGALRVLRFPDGTAKPLGGVRLAREMSHSSFAVEVDRHEILYAASALRGHPSETTATAAWNRSTDAASSAAAVHSIRYFDRNRGRAAEAYHLVRIAKRARGSFSAGASASYRDTGESRFRLIGASAAPLPGGGFAYSYDARYEPYWTPRNLIELRGIIAATIETGRATLRLHADGGWARDRDLIFGPAGGTASLAPLFPAPIEVARTFRPWRVSSDIAVPLRHGFTLTLGAERQTTVFYRATAFRAGFTGRL